MSKKHILFDAGITGERISDLRKGENKHNIKYTQRELCEQIEAAYGFSFSVSKLSKLEAGDTSQIPNINILLAIADFFDVSLEYLIGRYDVATPEFSYRKVSKLFGLSQRAMESMAYMNTHKILNLPSNYNDCSEMEFVNRVIAEFPSLIETPSLEYWQAYENYMNFIEKYGKEKNGKKSQRYLDLEGLPIGIEDNLIDEAQELKNILDIKRMNILSKMEGFLKKIRRNLIIKENDGENN